MNLFIDTNIYLTFYHLSNDDLEELNKVFILQKSSNITLWVTEQVEHEFKRNREVKIADALKRFREEKLNNQIPQMVKEYPEFDDLKKAIKSFDTAKNTVLDKLKRDINSKSLKADQLISAIFSQSKRATTSAAILSSAKLRFDCGNPPGKNESYGDAISWECLLTNIPKGEDLYLITEDGDYYSPLNSEQLNGYLKEEWESRKNSELHIYRRLSQFLADKFPSAKLATELEKELTIKNLAESRSFARTHEVISELNRFTDFTPPQINDIVGACLSNRQVQWIICDQDVKNFIEQIIAKYGSMIEFDRLDMLKIHLEQCVEVKNEDVPF